jgi:hypothetical protein
VRVILSYPLVLRAKGYYVANLDAWDRFGTSTEARVRWLKAVLEETPDFGGESLRGVQLGAPKGWLAVVSGDGEAGEEC